MQRGSLGEPSISSASRQGRGCELVALARSALAPMERTYSPVRTGGDMIAKTLRFGICVA